MATDLPHIIMRLFAFFVVAKSEPFLSAGAITRSHRKLSGNHAQCRAIAMRILPTPAVKEYDQCFKTLLAEESDHDWSIPGSEVAAQIQCWCRHNLTSTIKEYGCCEHGDIKPLCDTVCQPDCTSSIALSCIQDCPSMCFEAGEYILEADLCKRCNWVKCWPVVRCLTAHARVRVENNTLARTCHENDFVHANQLQSYWKCWKHIPKHTSHWNILSSLVHCICREGMIQMTQDTHCCDSVRYGWGVCSLQCQSEETCATQEAQTCIHSCQRKCPAYDVVPSDQCLKDCLKDGSPCKKYTSCRPPSVSTHVCDDGRWPEASSGCCMSNESQLIGCPKLCETQRIWRLDRTRAIPWWARWHNGKGITSQCTCVDCPDTNVTRFEKLKQTLVESVWDNGQVMLIDVARRENLQLGPNRKMQELMLRRNSEILQTVEVLGSSGQADSQIAAINDRYGVLITEAARLGEDPFQTPFKRGPEEKTTEADGEDSKLLFTIVIAACSVAVICTVICTAVFLVRMWKKIRKETPIQPFQQGSQIVIGNPIPQGTAAQATTGAPVTVAAATKTKGGSLQ